MRPGMSWNLLKAEEEALDVCPNCKGTKQISESGKTKPCPTCNATGKTPKGTLPAEEPENYMHGLVLNDRE